MHNCPLCDQGIDAFFLVVIDTAASIRAQGKETKLLPRLITIDNLICSSELYYPDTEGEGSFHFYLSEEKCSQVDQK